jgi:hypothetical protein
MLLLASSVCGLFKRRQFEPEVILLAVGWYLRFSLSYRDVEELLAARGLHADHVTVVLGPVDTDMNRGLEIPKALPECAAAAIFDGLEKREEDIFPDPVSQSVAEGWRAGVVKALERQFTAFVPQSDGASVKANENGGPFHTHGLQLDRCCRMMSRSL